jgi:hypothetical protein
MENGKDGFTVADAGRLTVLALATVLSVATATSAQEAAWEKVDLGGDTLWQDPDWSSGYGTRYSRKPSRLAADDQGRVYLSNGPNLLIGTELGNTWSKVAGDFDTVQWREFPVAAAGNGLVLWAGRFAMSGGAISRNGGATWENAQIREYASSLALFKDGTRFVGGSHDYIERAAPGSSVWTNAHRGRTYGKIHQFAVSEGPCMLALPMYAALLISRDSGKTWNSWRDTGIVPHLYDGRVQTMALDRRSGNSLWMAVRRSNQGPANALIRSYNGLTTSDTLENLKPDSSITAMIATGDGSLWVGTAGQGVWVLRSPAEEFARADEGIEDPWVEALVEASDGSLFALTRSGLYRQKSGPTVLRPRASPIAAAPARAILHVTGPTQPPWKPLPAGRRNAIPAIRADGRIVIRPGAQP